MQTCFYCGEPATVETGKGRQYCENCANGIEEWFITRRARARYDLVVILQLRYMDMLFSEVDRQERIYEHLFGKPYTFARY